MSLCEAFQVARAGLQQPTAREIDDLLRGVWRLQRIKPDIGHKDEARFPKFSGGSANFFEISILTL